MPDPRDCPFNRGIFRVAIPATALLWVCIFPLMPWLCVQADALRTWIVQ
ncbi:MAG: hypothetical protein U9R64_15125 [Pseudomonadota bacterium]|nr:hypothetical protein [Pseudomonadota bacterium]